MTRPRVAVLVSGIIASTAAFLVVSHWRLTGTLAGAAIVSAVFTLISHYSSQGLERVSGRLQQRAVRQGRAVTGDAAMTGAEEPATSTDSAAVHTGGGARPGGRDKTSWDLKRWSPAIVAVLACAFSIYGLSVSGTVETTVVRERVIEKTVTVSTEAGASVTTGSGHGATDSAPQTDTVPTPSTTPPAASTADDPGAGAPPTTPSSPAADGPSPDTGTTSGPAEEQGNTPTATTPAEVTDTTTP